MAEYHYRVTFIDTRGLKTSMGFLLADAVYADAMSAAQAIEAALELVTDANVYSSFLIEGITGATSLPGDADITDEALVVTYLSGAGDPAKFWNLRIPAPKSALFNADAVTIDITNQNLQDLVSTLSTEALVSDGESIDTEVNEGISHGFWRSVKKSTA